MGNITHSSVGDELTQAQWEGTADHLISGVSSNVVRTATYVVAASNASTQSKAQADAVTTTNLAADVAVAVALGYKSISLSEGAFPLTSAILLGDDMYLKGQGSVATLLTGNLTSALIKSSDQTVTKARWIIECLGLSNTSKTNSGGVGIDWTNVVASTIRDVSIWYVETGIKCGASGGGTFGYNSLYDVQIYTTVTAISGLSYTRIFGGRINTCTTGVTVNAENSIYGLLVEIFTSVGIDVLGSAWDNVIIAPTLENGGGVGIGVRFQALSLNNHLLGGGYIGLLTPISDLGIENTIIVAEQDNWKTYTPTVTSGAGAITTYTATGQYKFVGDTMFLRQYVLLTDVGTATGIMYVTLPTGYTQRQGAVLDIMALSVLENSITGAVGSGEIQGTADYTIIREYDGTTPFTNNYRWIISGFFRVLYT